MVKNGTKNFSDFLLKTCLIVIAVTPSFVKRFAICYKIICLETPDEVLCAFSWYGVSHFVGVLLIFKLLMFVKLVP